jgi:hypothetical protein
MILRVGFMTGSYAIWTSVRPRHAISLRGLALAWRRFVLKGFPHSSYDIVTFGPGPVQEFGEQPTLARSDRPAIHLDVELTVPALLELDRDLQPVPDQCSEPRRIRRRGGSRVAIYDSNAHAHFSPFPRSDSRFTDHRSLVPAAQAR